MFFLGLKPQKNLKTDFQGQAYGLPKNLCIMSGIYVWTESMACTWDGQIETKTNNCICLCTIQQRPKDPNL